MDEITALEVIYNDQVRSATERRQEYEELFPPRDHTTLPGFKFQLQPGDAQELGIENWGIDPELTIHENMFAAQESRQIFSLSLAIVRLPPEPLDFPPLGQEEWRKIFATNVSLKLLFAPDDGLEVTGGQAEFLTAPADDRWYLVEWTDLPPP